VLKENGIFAFKVHGSALMMAGLPDIIACVDGKFVGLETKLPETRKNTSAIQDRVHQLIELAGGTARVVCGPAEALAITGEASTRITPGERRALILAIRDLAQHMNESHTETSDRVRGRQEGEQNAFHTVIDLLEGRL
jgi:hypothetical protein